MSEGGKSERREVTLGYAVQLIVALGAIAIFGSYVGVRRYTSQDPHFCESCHEVAPEVGMWLESEHHDLKCQECHHATIEEGLGILWVYLLGEMPDIEHAKVNVRSCAGCHASHDDRWPQIANSSGHRTHTTAEGLRCTDCHGQQMHFGQPPREICLKCHEGQDTGVAHEASHCLACHNFLSTEEELLPQRPDCMRCHAKQDRPILISPGAPMQFVCSGCHEPHKAGRIAPCSECHRPSELAGLHEHPDHQVCEDCHEPHDWTSKRLHCLSCHSDLYAHHPERKRCASCHRFENQRGEKVKGASR